MISYLLLQYSGFNHTVSNCIVSLSQASNAQSAQSNAVATQQPTMFLVPTVNGEKWILEPTIAIGLDPPPPSSPPGKSEKSGPDTIDLNEATSSRNSPTLS